MAIHFVVFLLATIGSLSAIDLNFNARSPNAAVKCESGLYPPSAATKVPGPFRVNLREPALTRWRSVVVPRAKLLNDSINDLYNLVVTLTRFKNLTVYLDTFFPLLLAKVSEPIRSEIIGISVMTKIPLGRIVFVNLAYDMLSFCTSIVAQDANGQVFHGRNLDWGEFSGWDKQHQTWMLTQRVRELLVNVEFTNGGNTVFTTTQITGYVGVLSGIKPHSFSFTIDRRFRGFLPFEQIGEMLLAVEEIVRSGESLLSPAADASPVLNAVISREIFALDSTYEQAKSRLSKTPIFSPVYFILAGTSAGQGCVITREKQEVTDLWEMSAIPTHSWFVLETNYDHWKKPPFFDDRSGPGDYCMSQLGQQAVTPAGLFNVLSTRPVLNKATVHSILMQPATGFVESYLQDCKSPCPLW